MFSDNRALKPAILDPNASPFDYAQGKPFFSPDPQKHP